MFVRQPQKQESDNRNHDAHWENHSHITRREIMRDDHLANVPRSCAPGERRRGYKRCKSKRQASFECNHSCNTHTQTCESNFCLERTVFPTNEFCRQITNEDMEDEIHEVVYA